MSLQDIILNRDSLLIKEVQTFIASHESADVQSLVLKHNKILGVPTSLIADQILARRKAKVKLPEYYLTRNILFPPALNLEQSSSEATARFKARMLERYGPLSCADLTGGWGVDACYFSRSFHVDFIEPDPNLLQLAKHNHQQLHAWDISYHNLKAENFLSRSDSFDIIFLDPDRRKNSKRVSRLTDAAPDVVALRSELLQKAPRILVKASPLLDIKQGVTELKNVSNIFVVSVDNECKELLFLMKREQEGPLTIDAVDLDRLGQSRFSTSFTVEEEKNAVSSFSAVRDYLYEPNSSILKAGGFKHVGQRFAVDKLAATTHLYTSAHIMNDFPGRIFKVLESVKLGPHLRQAFADGYANMISRNHPLSVAEIKKKTGLKEGGVNYLICTRSIDGISVLIAERIK